MSRRKPKREPGTTRFAACPCPHCGIQHAATNFYADVRPKSGSIAICFKCGAVSLYTDAHGHMRKATPEEMQEMRADAELWTLTCATSRPCCWPGWKWAHYHKPPTRTIKWATPTSWKPWIPAFWTACSWMRRRPGGARALRHPGMRARRDPPAMGRAARHLSILHLRTHRVVAGRDRRAELHRDLHGSSGIGRALGIHATDSYMHQIPEVRTLYMGWQQTPTDPPPYVQKIEANAAVKKSDPEVVLGAFVTQRWQPGCKEGNAYGPLEEEWLDDGKVYIHVGNLNVHGRNAFSAGRTSVLNSLGCFRAAAARPTAASGSGSRG